MDTKRLRFNSKLIHAGIRMIQRVRHHADLPDLNFCLS